MWRSPLRLERPPVDQSSISSSLYQTADSSIARWRHCGRTNRNSIHCDRASQPPSTFSHFCGHPGAGTLSAVGTLPLAVKLDIAVNRRDLLKSAAASALIQTAAVQAGASPTMIGIQV